MPSDCMCSACACDCGTRVITPKEVKKKFDKLTSDIEQLVMENEQLKEELAKTKEISEVIRELERRKKNRK